MACCGLQGDLNLRSRSAPKEPSWRGAETILGSATCPPSSERWWMLSGGAWHAVALRADRSVVCWGRNEFGQLNVPADLGPVVQISGDRSNVTMVLLADGSVRHWGQWNEVWTNPTPPAGVGTWREIACGGYHAIGIPDQPPCPGDVNGDGVADGADLSILLSSWGACP